MRTAQICPTCATYTNAKCVIYDGLYLTNSGISPKDNLEYALGLIDGQLGVLASNIITTNNNLATTNSNLATTNSNVAGNTSAIQALQNKVNYKSYVARISQTGTGAPTIDYLLKNEMGSAVTFGYGGSPGEYSVNCTDFVTGKTFAILQPGLKAGGPLVADITTQVIYASGAVGLLVLVAGVAIDGSLNDATLEIRVYP